VAAYPEVKLGEVLRPHSTTIEIEPSALYKQVTVKLWGKGLSLRNEVAGSEIGSQRVRVSKGQFVISKIDARHGASGVVPAELDGALVSNDFPAFDVDASRLDVLYLGWLSKTKAFVESCIRASEGTTNRVRLKLNKFYEVAIPLAPLDEQRRIVARIDELASGISRATSPSFSKLTSIDALWESSLNQVFRTGISRLKGVHEARSILELQAQVCKRLPLSRYNNAHPHTPTFILQGLHEIPLGWLWTDLGSVLSHLVDCVNDTPDFSVGSTAYLGLKSSNIKPYTLDLTSKWYMTHTDCEQWNRREAPHGGDIVLTREAPMGHACILPSDFQGCLTQRLMLLRTDESYVHNRYLLHYLNSPQFKAQVDEQCRGLTVPHIRVGDLPQFLIPLPPLQEQHCIVAYLDSLQAKVDEAKRLHNQVQAELDALLPSILDRAFNGGIQ
jgi:type I restriction enzyme, S subunit